MVLVEKIPRNLIWALGFKETIDCPVDANPPVNEIVWTKNGLVIKFLNNRMQLLANGTLLINKVRQEDAGNYRCTAVSNLGNGESEIIQVEVKGQFLGLIYWCFYFLDKSIKLSIILLFIVFFYVQFFNQNQESDKKYHFFSKDQSTISTPVNC